VLAKQRRGREGREGKDMKGREGEKKRMGKRKERGEDENGAFMCGAGCMEINKL
jgi:hypothetical protein